MASARAALVLWWLCLSTAGVRTELIDLSHNYDDSTIYWFKVAKFTLTELFRGAFGNGAWVRYGEFSTQEHGGTHMDAPGHFNETSWSLEEIPIEHFIANAAVIDIRARAAVDEDALVTDVDLELWKQRHGPFRFPTVVIMKTGYSDRWPDRDSYMGIRPDQPEIRHFPGLSGDAAQILAVDAAVVGVGTDAVSIDRGIDHAFPAHQILAPMNVYNLENLADLSRVPAAGATIMAFPTKITGGSGAPCRVIMDVPDGQITS